MGKGLSEAIPPRHALNKIEIPVDIKGITHFLYMKNSFQLSKRQFKLCKKVTTMPFLSIKVTRGILWSYDHF